MTHPLVEQIARIAEPEKWEWLDRCEAHRKETGEVILTEAIGREQSLARASRTIAATLAGIREPSWKAEQLGHYAIGEAIARNGGMNTMSDAGDCWRAMIDALAKEVAGDG